MEGEEKRLREYRRGFIFVELWEPWRPGAFETEFSRLRVSCAGEKVLELRWDRADFFSVVLFKPGEWEERLVAQSRARSSQSSCDGSNSRQRLKS